MASFTENITSRKFYVGIMLILLYGVFVSLVVVSFSAHVIRLDWDARLATTGDSAIEDFNSLNFLLQQEVRLEAEIDDVQRAINAGNEAIIAVTTAESEADAAHDAATQRFDQALREVKTHLISAENFLSKEEMITFADILPDPTTNDLRDVQGALFFMATVGRDEVAVSEFVEPEPIVVVDPNAPPPPVDLEVVIVPPSVSRETIWIRSEALATKLTDAGDALHRAKLALNAAESNTQRAHEARSFLEKDKLQLEAAHLAVQELVPAYSAHRARWAQLFRIQSWWNPLPTLVQSPTILLTLLATIAAGALGTLVSFSRTTFKQEGIPPGQLLIIIGEGIAAAIAVFLFAGAGMLVLSQGGGADGRLELSPFTVAFLAFLSGFMSEQAFDKIREKGGDLFGKTAAAQAAGGSGAPAPGTGTPPAGGSGTPPAPGT